MQTTEFKNVPLKSIKADPNQPRHFYDEAAMEELTASVREKGILQPILLRPSGKTYMIVCGERRYRAALSVNAAFKDRNEIPAIIRELTDEEALELQIIENLQLMSGLRGKNDNREQEISTISRNLKALAKELKVPVIALSQLSRGVEKVNREPMLSDLRESGAIEQDADMVIFLTAFDEVDIQKDLDNLRDFILMKIAKHRNGPLDKISVRFVKEI